MLFDFFRAVMQHKERFWPTHLRRLFLFPFSAGEEPMKCLFKVKATDLNDILILIFDEDDSLANGEHDI
jgi:hypothetical protein